MLSWLGFLAVMLGFILGSTLAVVFVRALVLQILWGWFVVEQFGLEPLSFRMTAGLILTAMTLYSLWESVNGGWKDWYRVKKSEDQDKRQGRSRHDLAVIAVSIIVPPLTILALGWVLKRGL